MLNDRLIKAICAFKFPNIGFQQLIFQLYCGTHTVGKIESPFDDDERASCSLFYGDEGTLMFYDFRSKETLKWYQLPCKAHGIPFDYNKSIELIARDLKIEQECSLWDDFKIPKFASIQSKSEQKVKSDWEISVITKQFSEIDLAYWQRFGISEDLLRHFSIYTANLVFMRKIAPTKGEWFEYHRWRTSDPIYVYHFIDKNGRPKFKLLRPMNPDKKWKSNLDTNDKWCFNGYRQLPESGDLLIITKSLKDVVVLKKLGFTAVAPQSEIPNFNEELLVELKSRFKRIAVLYDNDATGRENSVKLANQFQTNLVIEIPENQAKDVSDFVEATSEENAKEFILYQLSLSWI